MSQLCVGCHKEIGWLVDRRRGVHARVAEQRCASCHPDHAGVEFAMIAWPDQGGLDRFDHSRAGWALADKHGELKCADCHKPALRASEAAKLSPRRGPDWGWVGLEQSCVSCHDDAHRGALDRNCTTCHDARRWSPAPRFDHAKTQYPLTGAHEKTKCAACHQASTLRLASDRRGRPIPLYRPLQHRECTSCHEDPHRAKLGASCSGCHVTSSWKDMGRSTFDHERTRYPLRGRHAAVRCEKCHDFSPAGKLVGNPQYATCGACHNDAHAGTATLASRTVDCASCHLVDGWKPATYTVAQHRLAKYPLEGRHERVACAACHVKNPRSVPATTLGTAAVWMRPVATRCQSCHADDHNGQLARRANAGACEGCHTVAGWTPSTYTVATHATLRLRLTGRHGDVKCAACHGPARPGLKPVASLQVLGKAGVALALETEVECVSCHVDPHRGHEPRCLDCHDTKTFRPSTIDVAAHRRYRLPLDGAHRAVSCVDCHADMKHAAAASSLVLTRWAFADILLAAPEGGCAGCHETPHGRQFASRVDRGACDKCHGTGAFRPADRFDHDRDARFTLKGAHARVACARCHLTSRKTGTPIVVYRPLSAKCETCHSAEIRRGS